MIAEVGGEPAAVGCLRLDGQVLLNYVAPAARFHGASDAMLTFMEGLARQAGLCACALESTATAHRFYLRRGYIDMGTPGEKFGVPNFPMRKTLSPSPSRQMRP